MSFEAKIWSLLEIENPKFAGVRETPAWSARPRNHCASAGEVAFAEPATVRVLEAMERSRGGPACDLRGFFSYYDAKFGWGDDVPGR